ncbi:hypothetical protein GGS23DRAFT_560762 [Durotheca rogersii]|uniref:uncharacterized protein n=1 Tax=Durotheca rogersii TaxID=419775 RepID=UPI00221E7256|nr:uncharacterized protein GGS23DRAFT_560762 [Durotheca rogersii]KAI5864560.1 hypothetical protein GGS23DRAFT_560762 [Durotheca rogersii]
MCGRTAEGSWARTCICYSVTYTYYTTTRYIYTIELDTGNYRVRSMCAFMFYFFPPLLFFVNYYFRCRG